METPIELERRLMTTGRVKAPMVETGPTRASFAPLPVRTGAAVAPSWWPSVAEFRARRDGQVWP